jgi:hypothetical protein
MRKAERLILNRLVSQGIPRAVALSRVDWLDVRQRLQRGEKWEAIAENASRGSLAFLGPVPIVPAVSPGDVINTIGDIIKPLLPQTPPLPPGIEVEFSLENCQIVYAGRVSAGDYMEIDVSNNGFPLVDTQGTVEVIVVPPIAPPAPGQTVTPTIVGNSSFIIDGPCTVYLHLKGPEDACDVEVTVYPRSGASRP